MANAHPHASGDQLALVHNGIIENHEELRRELQQSGRQFSSETDTEVMVHLIAGLMDSGLDLFSAVRSAAIRLRGAFAIAVVSAAEPGVIVGARKGSPLVLGVGDGENFLASDIYPLLGETENFVFLQEGDAVRLNADGYQVIDANDQIVQRPVKRVETRADAVQRGVYPHYMLKEIFEQPHAVAETLEGRLGATAVLPNIFGVGAEALLQPGQAGSHRCLRNGFPCGAGRQLPDRAIGRYPLPCRNCQRVPLPQAGCTTEQSLRCGIAIR